MAPSYYCAPLAVWQFGRTRGVIHGGSGFFSPSARDVLVAKMKELGEKAGRTP